MKSNTLLIGAILTFVGFASQTIVKAEAEDGNLKWHTNLTTGLITEADTGLQFRKVCGIGGSKDVIDYPTGLHISPNGKFLLFNNNVVPLENGDAFQLVESGALRSSWSPDGKKIAFYSGGIWLINVSPETGRAAGPARKIVEGAFWYNLPVQWAPDSDRFAFQSRDGKLHVFSIKDDSSIQITDDNVMRTPGAWSPDGQHIACRHSSGGVSIVPVKDGEPRQLVETKTRVVPYWSPDGKWVFFRSSGELQFVLLGVVPDDCSRNSGLHSQNGFNVVLFHSPLQYFSEGRLTSDHVLRSLIVSLFPHSPGFGTTGAGDSGRGVSGFDF